MLAQSIACPVCDKNDAIQKVSGVVASGQASGTFSGPTGGVVNVDGKWGTTGGYTTFLPTKRWGANMNFPVAVPDLAPPVGSRVMIQIAVSADFNISAEVARQKANRFLIMNLGDQLHAGIPELVIGEHLFWRVPVHLALSRGGYLGKIGDLQIDAQTGDILVESPQTLIQLADHAEVLTTLPLYHSTNLPAHQH